MWHHVTDGQVSRLSKSKTCRFETRKAITSQENDGCQADDEGMKKDCLIIDMDNETTGQKCTDYD